MIKFKADWSLKKPTNNNNQISLQLDGERVFLRPPLFSDFQDWHMVRSQNKDFLTPFEPQWSADALTQEFFKRRLLRQRQEMMAGRGLFFLIFKKECNSIMGGFNLNNIQYGVARCASVGYWLDEGFQGRGYMSEAAELVMDYVANTLKLHRLNAACLLDNERSAKLLLSLGFEEEGFAKKYLKINDQWQDHRLFGKIVDCKNFQTNMI